MNHHNVTTSWGEVSEDIKQRVYDAAQIDQANQQSDAIAANLADDMHKSILFGHDEHYKLHRPSDIKIGAPNKPDKILGNVPGNILIGSTGGDLIEGRQNTDTIVTHVGDDSTIRLGAGEKDILIIVGAENPKALAHDLSHAQNVQDTQTILTDYGIHLDRISGATEDTTPHIAAATDSHEVVLSF